MPLGKTDLGWGTGRVGRFEKVRKGCGVTQEACPAEVMRISYNEGVAFY